MPAKGTCSADLKSSTDNTTMVTADCAPYTCDPGTGGCLQACTGTPQCQSNYSCDTTIDKCIPTDGSGSTKPSGGCTISAGPMRSGESGGVAVALAALGASRLRRRRRARARD